MSLYKDEKRQIIHVITDDKFVDSAYQEFEETAPEQNKWIIIGRARDLTYVKFKSVAFLSEKQFMELIKKPAFSAVVFHKLPSNILHLLPEIPPDLTVIWVGWGFDYYDRLLAKAFPKGLLLPKTKRLTGKYGPNHSQSILAKASQLLSLQKVRENKLLRNQLARVDYFSPVLDIEYDMAIELNSWFRPKYIDWTYGPAEGDQGNEVSDSLSLGLNILVGNSADPTNNHLEMFDLLDHYVDLSGRMVFVPLSYGQDWYRDKVIDEGRRIFGDNFFPITEFMSKSSYIDLLQSCGYVFMNHVRQQAVGSIRIMLLKGARVFLHPQSPTYHWAIKMGLHVQSNMSPIEKFSGDKMTLEMLGIAQRRENIEKIMEIWGRTPLRKRTQRFVEIATGIDE